MKYRLSDLSKMMRSPGGRIQLRTGVLFWCFPLLSIMARVYRKTLLRRTCITVVIGSFGKSTTTRVITAALGLPVQTNINRNAFSSVALAILRISPWQKSAVVEVGISDSGQMIRYARITIPDVVVITSLGSEGIKAMGSVKTIREEKSLMVRALSESGTAVVNGDDPNVMWMASQTTARVVTYGFKNGCDVQVSDLHLDWPEGSRFSVCVFREHVKVFTQLIGRHMVYPALAALAVSRLLGHGLDTVVSRIGRVPPTPRRLERITLPSGAILLSDECKSTIETMHAALDVLEELPVERRIAVLGDVSESRANQVEVYGQLGERVAACATHLIIVGRGFRDYAAGALRGGMSEEAVHDGGKTPHEVVAVLRPLLRSGDVVLVKARKGQRLERIGMLLQGRSVGCELRLCELKVVCATCPMRIAGWTDRPHILQHGVRE